jgi:hypothetical protein
MQKRDYYGKWAKSYSNTVYLKKLDAVVFVEGKTDKPFWEAVFAHFSKRVRVISGEDNVEKQASGKQECLRYLPHVKKRFFIAIDSDYDYIKQAHPEYNAQKFVLQTYTYAIENHYLASNDGLQDFLKRYSNIIYGVFLAHLAEGGSVNKFCKSVAIANARDESLEALRSKIRERQPSCADNPYAAQGLTADNVHLFIKAKMLKSALGCGSELSFNHFPMDKIQSDIAEILP